eukprot:scaffold1155_cov217-Pinguiococcus_pyrenoidosus.AAC.2
MLQPSDSLSLNFSKLLVDFRGRSQLCSVALEQLRHRQSILGQVMIELEGQAILLPQLKIQHDFTTYLCGIRSLPPRGHDHDPRPLANESKRLREIDIRRCRRRRRHGLRTEGDVDQRRAIASEAILPDLRLWRQQLPARRRSGASGMRGVSVVDEDGRALLPRDQHGRQTFAAVVKAAQQLLPVRLLLVGIHRGVVRVLRLAVRVALLALRAQFSSDPPPLGQPLPHLAHVCAVLLGGPAALLLRSKRRMDASDERHASLLRCLLLLVQHGREEAVKVRGLQGGVVGEVRHVAGEVGHRRDVVVVPGVEAVEAHEGLALCAAAAEALQHRGEAALPQSLVHQRGDGRLGVAPLSRSQPLVVFAGRHQERVPLTLLWRLRARRASIYRQVIKNTACGPVRRHVGRGAVDGLRRRQAQRVEMRRAEAARASPSQTPRRRCRCSARVADQVAAQLVPGEVHLQEDVGGRQRFAIQHALMMRLDTRQQRLVLGGVRPQLQHVDAGVDVADHDVGEVAQTLLPHVAVLANLPDQQRRPRQHQHQVPIQCLRLLFVHRRVAAVLRRGHPVLLLHQLGMLLDEMLRHAGRQRLAQALHLQPQLVQRTTFLPGLLHDGLKVQNGVVAEVSQLGGVQLGRPGLDVCGHGIEALEEGALALQRLGVLEQEHGRALLLLRRLHPLQQLAPQVLEALDLFQQRLQRLVAQLALLLHSLRQDQLHLVAGDRIARQRPADQ